MKEEAGSRIEMRKRKKKKREGLREREKLFQEEVLEMVEQKE